MPSRSRKAAEIVKLFERRLSLYEETISGVEPDAGAEVIYLSELEKIDETDDFEDAYLAGQVGRALVRSGREEEATVLLFASLERFGGFGEDDPTLIDLRAELFEALCRQGRFGEARKIFPGRLNRKRPERLIASAEQVGVVNERGVALRRPEEYADVLGAADLPGGGTIVIDLEDPIRVVELRLPERQITERTLTIAETLGRSMQSGELGWVPDEWLRLALVAGVDRWFDHRVDEGLLAADRALALHEAGDSAGAAELWQLAEPAVARIVTWLPAGQPAMAYELGRLLGAFGSPKCAPAPTAVETLELPEPQVPLPPGVSTLIDAKHVPQRLIRPPLQVWADPEGGWEIRCRPFPGLDPDLPGVHRLAAVATDPDTQQAIGFATLTLRDGQFRGWLPQEALGSGPRRVEVVDVLSAHQVRFDQEAIADCDEDVREFTMLRLNQARAVLTGAPDTDALRPLLAELAALTPSTASR